MTLNCPVCAANITQEDKFCPSCKTPLYHIKTDSINPSHYRSHPSNIECIQITEHMDFCLGNSIKYIWRAGLKSSDPIEDLEKAKWYLERKINQLKKES